MSNVYGQTLLDDMVQTQGLPMPLVKEAAKEILAVIREGLINDGVVNVSNFGTFRLKLAAARNGFNPQTRERLVIPAHQRVIFSPCKALRDLIQPVRHPVIPIESEDTTQRAAARSASIAAVAPVATKLIVPPSQPVPEKAEVSEITPHTPAAVTEERRVTSDRRHPSDEAQTETPEAPPLARSPKQHSQDVASRLDTYTDSANEIALEVGEETSAKERSKKGFYLGAAAVIVIAAVTASLMYNSTPEETPAATTTIPSASISIPTGPVITDKPPAEPTAEVPAEIPAVSETTAVEEVDYSTLYTEMADAQPDVAPPTEPEVSNNTSTETIDTPPIATKSSETRSITATELAPATTTEQVATAKNKPTSFFFTEKTHKIANGESLWRLARQHYKNPLLWPHIYQANAALINNPDSLRQGRTITLPSLQGSADNLTKTDRRNIAEGYYLTYLHYKKTGHKDAFFALLEAKRYDNKVVEEHRSLLKLSKVEEIMLGHQETMPF